MISGRRAVQGVDGLAQLLRRVGLDVAAENLADALWLAEQIGNLPGATNSEAEPGEGDSSKPRVIEVHEEASEERDRPDEPQFPLTQPQSQSQQEQRDKSEGIPVKVPAAPALRIRLDLARALRPLMRKVPSPGRMVIDEAATVSQIAEQRIWSPVLVPAPERWLDLALVVEESRSTPLWHETIAEFQTLAERQGAFRTVSTWRLTESSGAVALFPSWRGSVSGQRSRSPKEIVDPGGRRLILLLSDCTSSLWREGKIYDWLAEWGRHAPTAVMQLLPERLWSQSGLGMGLPVWLSAITPGTPSAQLDVEERVPLWSMLDEAKVQTTAVPVVTLQAEPLKQWAKVVAGAGEVKTSGVQFELKQGSSVSGDNGHKAVPQLDPSERVQRFRTTASFTAQKLAGLMAAAPVSSPIVDLIRQTLLPEAEPVHVAEVFMGGLMRQTGEATPRPAPTLVQYDFVDGVRPLLVDASSKRETERVLDTVSAYISERIGRSTKSFEALLSLNVRGDETAEEMVLPFAQIAGQVLKRMGGDYAAIADRLETAPKRTVVARDGDQVSFPPLQEFTFREAIVVVERSPLEEIDSSQEQGNGLTRFEFEAVTISVEGQSAKDFAAIASRLDEFLVSLEQPIGLNELQRHLLRGAWYGQPYNHVAEKVNEDVSAVRGQGGRLWRLLSDALGIHVTKNSLRRLLTNRFAQSGPQIIQTRKRRDGLQFVESLGEGVELEMVSIPGGTFMMGSPDDEAKRRDREGPQHKVTVQPFFMSKYPVTHAQWQAVASLPQVNRELEPDPSSFKGDDRPVEKVSWYEAQEFCDRLSQATGKDYRLPSEAEWEYACRAGTETPFHFGETITSDLVNYRGTRTYGNGPEGEYRQETTAVGTFPANAFGLHDMHGNVWEWCLDHWHGNYESAPADGSAWITDKEGASRVLRGGSWDDSPEVCRSAIRYYYGPAVHYYSIGFRVVCGSARGSNSAG